MGAENSTTSTIDSSILDIPLLSSSVTGVNVSNNTGTQLPIIDMSDLITTKNTILSDTSQPKLNVLDLSSKNNSLYDASQLRLKTSDPTLLDSGSARTDVMSNILLSQKAKKRQQLFLAKKMAGIASSKFSSIFLDILYVCYLIYLYLLI